MPNEDPPAISDLFERCASASRSASDSAVSNLSSMARRGSIDYSEGVYGPVRAFRIAGAGQVLMTLWPVDDGQARDFMVSFYSHWLARPLSDSAAALR